MKKLKIPSIIITPATHTWHGASKLARCMQCGIQTTGVVKSIDGGRKQPLCTNCARVKGF